MTDLQELLRRATEIEAASAAPEVKAVEDPVVPQVLEAVLERIEGLESSIKALAAPAWPTSAALSAAEVLGVDPTLLEAAEVKAVAGGALKCPECGSSNVTEYENATAECDDCGAFVPVPGGIKADPFLGGEVFESKGFDFDELADDADDLDEKAWADLDAAAEAATLEAKAAPAGGGRVVLSELELLRARRAALQD